MAIVIYRRTNSGVDKEANTAIYSIGKVSELTGINAITLRAWERRYNIVTPQRTESGHRLYSADDVEIIKTAKRLISTGIKISQVNNLIGSNKTPLLPVISTECRNNKSEWQSHIKAVIGLIHNIDLTGLEKFHRQLFANYEPIEIANMLCRPILEDLYKDTAGSTETTMHFHVYQSFIRQFLSSHLVEFYSVNDETRILVIDHSDKMHRILMLWYLVLLRAEGYNPWLLDGKLPLETIPAIAAKRKSAAVVIYDCEHIPFEVLADLDIPVFISNMNQSDIKLDGNKIKSLPYHLLDNIAELKQHISSSTSRDSLL